ncbi:dynactin 6, partial [Tremellales sp. Uapishka_1]
MCTSPSLSGMRWKAKTSRRPPTHASSNRQTRITAHSTSVICQDVELKGDITVGAGTVIHPKATILAIGGPIVMGSDCVVEEMAIIVNRNKGIMRIGDDNMFMVASRVESPSIGDSNTFQPRSKASSAVTISDHCTLSANTILLPLGTDHETLPPYTVVYGEDSSRRTWDGSGQDAERGLRAKHVEYLREVIPK